MDKLKKLKEICQKYDIALVYLFGSQVKTGAELLNGVKKEVTDPLADIDVGIVFKCGLPSKKVRWEVYSYIFNEMEDLFLPYPLDLVFLQETHSVFQANAICGRCIYYESLEFKESYEEYILARAADFRPFLEAYLNEVLEG